MAIMPLAALIYGAVLTTLGVVGFGLAMLAGGWRDPESLSALIPAGFGLVIMVLGALARIPRVQRPALVLTGVLAVAALAGTVPELWRLLEASGPTGAALDPMARMEQGRATGAVRSMSLMAVASLVYLVFTIRWAVGGATVVTTPSRPRRRIPWKVLAGGAVGLVGVVFVLGGQRSDRFASALARLSPLHRVVVLAHSSDGDHWSIDADPIAAPADIPELVTVGGRTFMFYLHGRDELLMMRDLSAPDSVIARPITLDPATTCDPQHGNVCVDPAAVALPGGEIRLYFVQGRRFEDPAGADQTTILSARSRDGAHFTVEPGVRLQEGARVDPDPVVLSDGRVRMYTTRVVSRMDPSGQGMVIESAISEDGLTFTVEPDVRLAGASASRTVAVEDGFRHWYHDVQANLWLARSTDGLTWHTASSPVLAANALPETRLLGMEAPGVVHTSDGWLMALSAAREPFWPLNELVAQPD